MVRVLALVASLPWLFGPYQHQGALLCEMLLERGHEVMYLAANTRLQAGNHSAKQVVKLLQLSNKPASDHVAHRVRFVGMDGLRRTDTNNLHVSDVNGLVRTYGIDALISVMDVDKIACDEPFATTTSTAWYPNHFAHLDSNFKHTLRCWSHVASLAPTDAQMLQSELGAAVQVSAVPHIVEDAVAPHRERLADVTRAQLRSQYEVPADASFVVLVSCGNYEAHNRKSLDVSLYAFRALLATHPKAFLYLHVIEHHTILAADRGASEAEAKSIAGSNRINMDFLVRRRARTHAAARARAAASHPHELGSRRCSSMRSSCRRAATATTRGCSNGHRASSCSGWPTCCSSRARSRASACR